MSPASKKTALIAIALMVLLGAPALRAEEPTIWLNVEVNDATTGGPKVKVYLPLSLIEVVIDSLDTTEVLTHLKADKGIDLADLWRNLRDSDVDEFVRIDTDDEKVKVFKEGQTLRVTVQEAGYEEPNVQIRVPFSIMDFLVEETGRGEFRFSEFVAQLRGSLPLVLVEASHHDERVKVWVEER